jgi:hypothetical protein
MIASRFLLSPTEYMQVWCMNLMNSKAEYEFFRDQFV